MNIYEIKSTVENQFLHPDPKGSELIFPAPFRDGVIRENQFANG
jgi:hypothetical protein